MKFGNILCLRKGSRPSRFIFENKVLYLSYYLFVIGFKKNLVLASCLFKHHLTAQFDYLALIKSNGTFIYFRELMNAIYFLTSLLYKINSIENTNN